MPHVARSTSRSLACPRESSESPPLLQDALLDETGKLGVVRARFDGFEESSFEGLISGYSSLKVLTCSSSVPIINRAAEEMEALEVVFGRAEGDTRSGRPTRHLHSPQGPPRSRRSVPARDGMAKIDRPSAERGVR